MRFSADEFRCELPECTARTHAMGLCRRHYDQVRRAATSHGRHTNAELSREWQIEAELEYGPRGRESVFKDEDDRRRAWEQRQDAMMERYLSPPYVSLRPWAWWRYVAGREQHLSPYPLHFDGSIEERAEALDEHEIEPIAFLAENGYLAEREIAAIEAKADEARPRIGTDAEHIGSGGVDRADRRRVKLAEAVRTALDAR
jgi:hypothetical protein